MIKAVIFDLDGTVTDTLSTIAHFGNFALNANGFSSIPEDKYKYFAGNGKKELIHRMLKYHNADNEENFTKTEKIYDEAYESDVIGKTTVFDGIIPLLENLHNMGIKTAVNSNKPHNVAVMVIEKLFPEKSFNAVYGQIDKIPHKPDPSCALKIAEEFGVLPEECLFAGDTCVDISTAKNAGMKAVGVLWGFRDSEELQSAGADFIVSKPEEILNIILKMENEKTKDN